jgi:Secretion system C-terminal sorting domain
MKNQKHIFNAMLLSYNRYVRKLKRLIANRLNFRKQEILEKRIAKMFEKLSSINLSLKRTTAIASAVTSIVLMQPNSVQAQNFDPPQLNPSGLGNIINSNGYTINQNSYFNLVDIDGDGDKDIFAAGNYSDGNYYNGYSEFQMYYIENTGSSSNPQFGIPIENPVWLQGAYPTSFVDIDADGDFDMFHERYFYRNIGTSNTPLFINETSPINNIEGYDMGFVDIDADGDFDVTSSIYFYDCCSGYYNNYTTFNFFENTGTVNIPNFEDESFYSIEAYATDCQFNDMDGDGDLDILALAGGCFLCFDPVAYYLENTGTAISPEFSNLEDGAFNLPPRPAYSGTINSQNIQVSDINNDGSLDLINLYAGNFYLYEIGDDCDSPDDLSAGADHLNNPLTYDGYSLNWDAPEGITKCELSGGVNGKRQFTKTVYGAEVSNYFVNEKFLRAETFYEFKVRCDCELDNQYGPFSYTYLFYTYDVPFYDLDWGFPKSNNQNIFAEESNIATTSNNVKLFPNPAKGSFAINTDLENYNIELRDVTGKLVYNQNNINQTFFNMDIKNIEAGTYFVKISNASSSEVVKLMVY